MSSEAVVTAPISIGINPGGEAAQKHWIPPYLVRGRLSEALRPQGGASRARSGEQDASKGNFIHIADLNPAYKAGLAGHAPVKAGMTTKAKRPLTQDTLLSVRRRLLTV
jgi:hypothetical protein